jgi:2-iminobutanoate/2-iminopropanoate deaminase
VNRRELHAPQNVQLLKLTPSPPSYSQRSWPLVCLRLGTGPFDPGNRKNQGDTIQLQTRKCLTNISAILKAAGSSMEKIVSATVILLEEEDFAGMNEEWLKWFSGGSTRTPRRKVAGSIPGMKISIRCR